MKQLLYCLLLSFTILACKQDLLDVTPTDRYSEELVWKDESLIKAYHTDLYNSIPHGFYMHMYSKFTDEAFNNAPCCGGSIMNNNNYNPDNIASAIGGGWGSDAFMYYWNPGYQYVRKVNLFLEKMTETGTIDFSDKKRLIAEAKFIRAYIYFELMKRFGNVPIVDRSYAFGDDATFKRNTLDECVAFMEADLDAAIPDLPARYASNTENFGRATQDACMALRSRLLLYAASPLFNPSHDMAKWQKAADAAEKLLNRGYSLYPDYRKLFILPSGAPEDEYIFCRNFTANNGHNAPMDNLGRRYGAYGGWWASNGPTQNLVDDYDMINGEPAFIYPGGVQTVNPASGYDPNHPYWNRDPRFDATIIHDSTIYRGDTIQMWISTDGARYGYDSYKTSSDNPRGNYWLKKFMPEGDVPISWQIQQTIPWPFFRLAEIYLNYAEAKFELGDETTCREYLSKVRQRVNLPPIPETVSGEALRQRVYNERRIELAFEAHRFFDIRRWKIAAGVENKPVMGMDIIKNLATGETSYKKIQLKQKGPYFEYMDLLPIERNELKRNPQITQNPGWN